MTIYGSFSYFPVMSKKHASVIVHVRVSWGDMPSIYF